ncbi:MAG TPA: TlpA disulfide reductase family protein [Nocardioidaceae bacterium]|nr:TlpA disulfide reductase family protein [Nocardioidaceae bacterium]
MSVLRGRPVLLTGVIVAVVAVVALLATGLSRGHTIEASPLVGKAAPDFHLQGLDGKPESAVRLSDLRGQVVVVNFWASWCAECRVEQPDLDQTWNRFRDAGVVVVGVDFQDTEGDARAYLAEAGSTYPVVVDTDSTAALAFGLRGVPETFVVDQRGEIVERVIGPVEADRLADRITGLLEGGVR